MKISFFAFIFIALLSAACNRQSNPQSTSGGGQNQPTPTPQTSNVYENRYLKVLVPEGWAAKEAAQTVYNGQVPGSQPNPAAVNITKGNYILYINTQASQASGVEGGRFAEIAQGAPSADAVVTEQPSPPCGTADIIPAILDHPRVDLYVSAQDTQSKAWCRAPKSGKDVWYFSYITDTSGGYFNYYNSGQGLGYVITMAYNSKDADSLPVKGGSELNSALAEMTNIVKTLEIKKH